MNLFNRKTKCPEDSKDPWAAICLCGEGFVAVSEKNYRGRLRGSERYCVICREKKAVEERKEYEKLQAIRNDKSKERCANCMYWKSEYNYQFASPMPMVSAQCHGMPPAPGWPETQWDNGCGKFKTRHVAKGVKK